MIIKDVIANRDTGDNPYAVSTSVWKAITLGNGSSLAMRRDVIEADIMMLLEARTTEMLVLKWPRLFFVINSSKRQPWPEAGLFQKSSIARRPQMQRIATERWRPPSQ